MINKTVPIVVVAYNRPDSLKRILGSLSRADYPDEDIHLIISIDHANSNEAVLEVARNFKWQYGRKLIEYQEVNLGLRKHIIQCAGLSLKYGAVIVLEDDLYVAPSFYHFVVAALDFSFDKKDVGGISLYNHQLNVHTRDNFTALDDGFDNYYFQFASSWGQAWTKTQWEGFIKWYDHGVNISDREDLPLNVRKWSDKSWLKFFTAYLVEKDKFFLYPRVSYTTNFGDTGTHVLKDSTIYQVPLYYGIKSQFTLSSLENSNSIYDSFFENCQLHSFFGYDKSELCVDLYAYKPWRGERYWLTSRILDYKPIHNFGRSLKPMDANIIENINGSDIYLYDTAHAEKNIQKPNKFRKLIYNTRHVTIKTSLLALRHLLRNKLASLVK